MTAPNTISAADYKRLKNAPSAIVKRMKKKSDEAQLQKAVVTYLGLQEALGRLKWFAVPNGGKRDLITAVNLKRQGVRAGVPDIAVLLKGATQFVPRTIFLELKAPKGRLSEAQQEWRDFFTANGIPFHVIKSLDDLKAALA